MKKEWEHSQWFVLFQIIISSNYEKGLIYLFLYLKKKKMEPFII
jgi:hypothetical protein